MQPSNPISSMSRTLKDAYDFMLVISENNFMQRFCLKPIDLQIKLP